MRILALVPAILDTSPGQRFRMEQWEPLLRGHGIEIDWEPFECERLHALLYRPGETREKIRLVLRGIARRIRVLRRVPDYDAVYVFREAAVMGPPIIERRVHRLGKPLIFDFDDAVWVPYVSPANRYASLLKFPGKTREICCLAALVMAGNPYLADYARAVNERVEVVPTTIDTARYEYREPTDRVGTVVGWSGSYSTVQHLDTLRPVLRDFAVRFPFTLRVLGSPTYAGEGYAVDARPWKAATEVDDLRGIDVGVMPLPDDVWSRGKCGLKALQYMALGIPAIASDVGVNGEIIRHALNGLLATTREEWIAALSDTLSSPLLRRQLATEARKTVETTYSALAQAPRVAEMLLAVGSGKRPAAGAMSNTPKGR